MVVAVGKSEWLLAVSKSICVATEGGKKGNYNDVMITKPKKKSITMKKGHTFTVKGKEIKTKKSKVNRYRALSYESTNKDVATISKGKVIAKVTGKTMIYVYTQNGMYKTLKVTVK